MVRTGGYLFCQKSVPEFKDENQVLSLTKRS